jgi:hypothetical protein
MDTETSFIVLIAILSGIALIMIARAYLAYQRKKKSFDFNPWA